MTSQADMDATCARQSHLQQIIDGDSLAGTLADLAGVCETKAEHARCDDDQDLAAAWDSLAGAVGLAGALAQQNDL